MTDEEMANAKTQLTTLKHDIVRATKLATANGEAAMELK
jgi:hypothetical protein